jgi:hypothetical protein
MGELCLVTQPKTAAELLKENAESMATVKLVSKRFPDAVLKSGRWESPGVTPANAQGIVPNLCRNPTDLRAMTLELYVVLRPKGADPVRIYSAHPYSLTESHVAMAFSQNFKAILKSLETAMNCQPLVP